MVLISCAPSTLDRDGERAQRQDSSGESTPDDDLAERGEVTGRPVVRAATSIEIRPASAAAPRLTTVPNWRDVLSLQNRGKIPGFAGRSSGTLARQRRIMAKDADDLESATRWRSEAVQAAQAVLVGDVSLFEGVRHLAGIGHRLVRDFWNDPDFSVLGAVDSETDGLPVGQERAHWDPVALAVKDREIADYESKVRDAVLAACRSNRTRYGAG